jgi:radical SAM protein with 4Fe4S-binding SPASM domain
MLNYLELRSQPRSDLTMQIPLPAPFVMFLEPTNVCNFRCPICPESFDDFAKQAGYYERMNRQTWQKVYGDLDGWCQMRTMRFYAEGEPLLNPHLDEIISQARPHTLRTELTTNASRLNEDWAERLVRCGLQYCRISIYATTDVKYELATGSRFKASEIRRNVQTLRTVRDRMGSETPRIYCELVSQEPDEATFRKQYETVADDLGLKVLHNWGGTAAPLVQLGQQMKTEKRVCPKPFYEIVVKANGDVSVCCGDWNGHLKIGNVHEEHLRDIWNGPAANRIRDLHRSDKREELDACRGCTLIYSQPDNLDSLIPSSQLVA